MVKLRPKPPCDGLLPLSIGTITAREATPGALTSLAPYKGRATALSSALESAHGLALPAPNCTTGSDGVRAFWFGQDMALLMGPSPDAGLAKHAALTDQSDAWAVILLEGDGARDVLARLTPIDLRETAFQPGDTVRTELQHMMASVTCTGQDSYLLMVFRAFAETLVHDLRVAMESVAAR